MGVPSPVADRVAGKLDRNLPNVADELPLLFEEAMLSPRGEEHEPPLESKVLEICKARRFAPGPSAQRLRRLLEQSDNELRPAGVAFAKSPPVDAETRFPLLDRVDLKTFKEPPIVLSEAQNAIVGEFLSVTKSHAQLEAQGVQSTHSLLMYGPPGCGKSRLARHIARELGKELFVARLDGLISSYLGSTAKNISALFEFAAKTPCVLFLDEFDAIAKLRGDTQELGELKRVVNSFIQNLDSLGSQSILLAATNHPTLLDSAIWRRFAYRLELTHPTEELRLQLWQQFLPPLEFSPKEVGLLVDLSEGLSGSDINEVCLRLHRRRITRKEYPTLHDAFLALQNVAVGEGEGRKFITTLKDQDRVGVTTTLRSRDPKLYSHAVVAGLLGISKATAYRGALQGEREHG